MNASGRKSTLKKLSPAHLGYIAGMIDGDGQLYMTYNDNGAYSRIRVRVTDECIVTHLRKVTGLGILSNSFPTQKRLDGGPKKRVHEWLVFRRVDVRDLLLAIYPHLVLKKKSAELLLNLERLKDQGISNGRDVERIKNELSKNSTRRKYLRR